MIGDDTTLAVVNGLDYFWLKGVVQMKPSRGEIKKKVHEDKRQPFIADASTVELLNCEGRQNVGHRLLYTTYIMHVQGWDDSR